MEILGIILLIVGIVLAIKFVRFLFLNWFVSRMLSLAAAVISLALPWFGANVWACVIISAASWCFLIGPVIFDVHYDYNEWDVLERDSDGRIQKIGPKKSGGFLANALFAVVVSAIIYFAIGSEYQLIYVIFPLILMVLNFLISRDFWMALIAKIAKKK